MMFLSATPMVIFRGTSGQFPAVFSATKAVSISQEVWASPTVLCLGVSDITVGGVFKKTTCLMLFQDHHCNRAMPAVMMWQLCNWCWRFWNIIINIVPGPSSPHLEQTVIAGRVEYRTGVGFPFGTNDTFHKSTYYFPFLISFLCLFC